MNKKKFLKYRKKILYSLSKDLTTKIIALFIAIILWLIVIGSKNVELSRFVSVSYSLSSDLIISNQVPEKVQIRFLGPRSVLRDLINNNYTLNLDLRDKKSGFVSFRLKNEIVNLPIGIKVLDVYPETITVKLDAVSKKIVDLRINHENNLQDGYKIKELTINPDKVEISGAQSDIAIINSIFTEKIDLSDLTVPKNFFVNIEKNDKITNYNVDKVLVYINVVPVLETKKFTDILVSANLSDRFKINPTSVDVFIEGPKLILDKLSKQDILANVDISLNAVGTYKEEVLITLPYDELQVTSIIPKRISVWIY